jgi:hypothetical protein
MLTYWLAQPEGTAFVMGDNRRASLEEIRADLRAKLIAARAELAGEGKTEELGRMRLLQARAGEGRGGRQPFNCGGFGCGSQPCTCEPVGEDWSHD